MAGGVKAAYKIKLASSDEVIIVFHHFLTAIDSNKPPTLVSKNGGGWCGREDSNFHGLYAHSDLNAARLPIPPRPHKSF